MFSPPINNIHHKEGDDKEIDQESYGQDVIPFGWGVDSVDQGFVVAIFVSRRFFIEIGIAETFFALKLDDKKYISKLKFLIEKKKYLYIHNSQEISFLAHTIQIFLN